MEQAGRLQRVHGGAVPVRPHPGAAQAADGGCYGELGRRVWSDLPRAGTLLIGAGRPALGLAEAICSDPPASAGLTVVTTSLDAAIALSRIPTLSVYNIGGTVSPRSRGQEGDWAITELNRLRVDVSVVCADGVSVTDGLSDATPTGAAVCRTATVVGGRVIVLADARAVGTSSFVQFATIEEIDELAVAGSLGEREQQPFLDRGTPLTVVPQAASREGRPDR